jgi:hypothetical protein
LGVHGLKPLGSFPLFNSGKAPVSSDESACIVKLDTEAFLERQAVSGWDMNS